MSLLLSRLISQNLVRSSQSQSRFLAKRMVIGSLGSLRSSKHLRVTVLRILGHTPFGDCVSCCIRRTAWGQTQVHEFGSHKEELHKSPRVQKLLVEIPTHMVYAVRNIPSSDPGDVK